jgi:hypothetical protein
MAGAYVTGWNNTNENNVTTITVTVGTNATADNLLVAIVTVRAGGDAFTTPTGWTLLTDASSGSYGSAVYYRKATGTTADNFTPVWTDPGQPTAAVAEYSGLDTTPTLEDSGEDDSAITTTVTSIGTGTATPTTANGLAIAFLALRTWDPWATTTALTEVSIDSGFTKDYHIANSNSLRPAVVIASEVYTSTAAQSATWSTTGTASQCYGAIGVFKEAAGGSPITVTVGTASETDSASAISAVNPRSYTIGAATEIDTAQAITAVNPRSYAVGLASETDSAAAVPDINPRTIAVGDHYSESMTAGVQYPYTGYAFEGQQGTIGSNTYKDIPIYHIADDAFGSAVFALKAGGDYPSNYSQDFFDSITVNGVTKYSADATKSGSAGLVSWTWAAQQFGLSNGVTYDVEINRPDATESDTASPIAASNPRSYSISQADETDSSFSVNAVNPRSYPVGLATELNESFAISASGDVIVNVGAATETDTSEIIAAINPRSYQVGEAGETDTAFAIDPVKDIVVSVGLASESNTTFAIGPTQDKVIALGVALETNSAFSITAFSPISVALGVANETDLAYPVSAINLALKAVKVNGVALV